MKSLVNAIAFDSLLKQLGTITPQEKLTGAYHAVRDIPYGQARSKEAEDVLEIQKGTGRGKHTVLQSILQSFGYEVKEFLARHNLAEYPINPWPEALKQFQGKDVPSFHNFLKVKIDGNWKTVDATFDEELNKFGFPLQDWDGVSDMELPVKATEVIEVKEDVVAETHALIQKLSEDERQLRQSFLKELKSWIETERAKLHA